MKCGQTLINGRRCSRSPSSGSRYCFQHQRSGSKIMKGKGNSIEMPLKGYWTVYGRDGCPFTQATKSLLMKLKKDKVIDKFKYYEITTNKEQYYKGLSKLTGGYRSVPIIFSPNLRFFSAGNSELQACYLNSPNLSKCS